jgi:hypothetical protein
MEATMMSSNQGVNQIVLVKEKASQIVRNRGPLLPVQITKELGINVMFASALLSELVDKKVLKLSNTKVGGSPMYYVTGQEPKLQELRDKLNDKQQRAFDILKQTKVLRDTEQEPVIRVALRDIKDFAHQLQVTSGGTTEIFWKWYLLTDAEAEPLIKEKLGLTQKKQENKVEKEVQRHLEEIEHNLKKLEEQKELLSRPIEQQVKEQVAKKSKERQPRAKKAIVEAQAALPIVSVEDSIDKEDMFMMKVVDYFRQNSVQLLEIKQIRRDSDFEGMIKIPSAVGSITYFCKAKNKQKITDADLSLLYVQSQMRKMPVLLITTGEVTKKAQELLTKEFKNITIKQL